MADGWRCTDDRPAPFLGALNDAAGRFKWALLLLGGVVVLISAGVSALGPWRLALVLVGLLAIGLGGFGWLSGMHADLARLRRIEEAAKDAAKALRVALHYTEAEYDTEGSEELIGCRIAERNLRDALTKEE